MTVVKHEAMAVRRSRQRELGAAEIDFDALENHTAASPEDQAVGADLVARSAEALQRLKPQEVRALWLRAQGNSYEEIQQLTGWSRTKVNRCLYEGRRSFLERYAGIQAGEECRRWEPLLSAVVDGEATPAQLLELRPHLRACSSCRALIRELHRTNAPLSVLLPAAGFVAVGDDAAGHLAGRTLETVTNWLGERAAASAARVQLLTESALTSASKLTAVAAASAAVAGGGMTAVEIASPAATPIAAKAAANAPLRSEPEPRTGADAAAPRRPRSPSAPRTRMRSAPTPPAEPSTPRVRQQVGPGAAAELGLE